MNLEGGSVRWGGAGKSTEEPLDEKAEAAATHPLASGQRDQQVCPLAGQGHSAAFSEGPGGHPASPGL